MCGVSGLGPAALWRDLPIDAQAFAKILRDFYLVKTLHRLAQYHDRCHCEVLDSRTLEINDLACLPAQELVAQARAFCAKAAFPRRTTVISTRTT